MFFALLAQCVALPRDSWRVHFSDGGQPYVSIPIGGVSVDLLLDTLSSQTAVVHCSAEQVDNCYKSTVDVRICAENALIATDDNPTNGMCFPGGQYNCSKPYLPIFKRYDAKFTSSIFDGLLFLQEGWEAKERIGVYDIWSPLKVLLRLPEVVDVKVAVSKAWPYFGTQYFAANLAGIFGIAPPSISCRKSSYWGTFMATGGIGLLALNFDFPPNAVFTPQVRRKSMIEFEVSGEFADKMLFSEEKQTGDSVNNGRYEFLMYRPQTCGTDLLYNVSSNWITVIDTRSRCLSLPPFLWDALVAWLGKSVECSMQRGGMCRVVVPPQSLPSFSFALNDRDHAERIELPLEQLVIKDGDGDALYLCVARADDSQTDHNITAVCPDSDGSYQFQSRPPSADMMAQHISFGSLVVSALYTVIDLENNRIGLASKYPKSADMSVNITCPASTRYLCGAQQTYFPPLNKCLDPECHRYMFLALDPDTHTCVWASGVGLGFVTIVVALVIAEIVSERLYVHVLKRAKQLTEHVL